MRSLTFVHDDDVVVVTTLVTVLDIVDWLVVVVVDVIGICAHILQQYIVNGMLLMNAFSGHLTPEL